MEIFKWKLIVLGALEYMNNEDFEERKKYINK